MVPEAWRRTWSRFWFEPLPAERLALPRILFGAALVSDQLVQYLPRFARFFGPASVAPAGLEDRWLLDRWQWTVWLTGSDHAAVPIVLFVAWVASAVAMTLGWHTRTSTAACWFLTVCFRQLNPRILNGGDKALLDALFILALAPAGTALSLDARGRGAAARTAGLVPAWPVRLLQLQLCTIYCTTGLAKLVQGLDFAHGWPTASGTWWEGTAVFYAINAVERSRHAYAQFPIPFWITAVGTYATVTWEVAFPVLVALRRTRAAALWLGLAFHLGIFLTLEVGWFGFYTLCYYAAWLPVGWNAGGSAARTPLPLPHHPPQPRFPQAAAGTACDP